LRDLGVRAGDEVSTMSVAPRAYSARLAGVPSSPRFLSEEEDAFWNADAPAQRRILQLLAASGAKIVITSELPSGANRQGWLPIGKTSFYTRFLQPADRAEDESPGSR
jgi:hypothetical protein